MTFYEPQEKMWSDSDPEMIRILEEMLEANETVTARAVARKHPSIKHASSITRNSSRSELLARFQSKQAQYRTWQARMPKRSREQLATQLAQKDSRIVELEHQVEILRVHNLAMIRTVGELGGISKLLKLYDGYRDTRNELNRLGVLPQGDVKQFRMPESMHARIES
jgi:hypothetical protein